MKPSACRCVRLSSPALQPRARRKFPGERRQLNPPGASARSWRGSTKGRVTPGSQGDTGRSRFRATKGEKRFASTKPESASPPSFCRPTASRSRAGAARRGSLAAVPPGPGLAGPVFFSASGKRQRRRMKGEAGNGVLARSVRPSSCCEARREVPDAAVLGLCLASALVCAARGVRGSGSGVTPGAAAWGGFRCSYRDRKSSHF